LGASGGMTMSDIKKMILASGWRVTRYDEAACLHRTGLGFTWARRIDVN
jgi:hypothetical protein